MNDRSPSHPDRVDPSTRVRRRLLGRIVLGAALGSVAGLLVGLLLGWAAFHRGSTGSSLGVGAAAVFGAMMGALLGGYLSLESPRPGHEPSEVDRPVLDRPSLTRRERDVPAVSQEQRSDTEGRHGEAPSQAPADPREPS